MPLKSKRRSSEGTVDHGYDTLDSSSQINTEESSASMQDSAPMEDDDPPDDRWLESLGVNAEEIRKINYTQVHLKKNNIIIHLLFVAFNLYLIYI